MPLHGPQYDLEGGEAGRLPTFFLPLGLWYTGWRNYIPRWVLGLVVPLPGMYLSVPWSQTADHFLLSSTIPCRFFKMSPVLHYCTLSAVNLSFQEGFELLEVRCPVLIIFDWQDTWCVIVIGQCFQILLLSVLLGPQGCDDRGMGQVCSVQMEGYRLCCPCSLCFPWGSQPAAGPGLRVHTAPVLLVCPRLWGQEVARRGDLSMLPPRVPNLDLHVQPLIQAPWLRKYDWPTEPES